jgi:hypothetical protein
MRLLVEATLVAARKKNGGMAMTSELATAWAIFVAASILPLVVFYLARH